MDNLQESLIEVTSGQAKYEHQHRAIVWRCPRLPKEGQGSLFTHYTGWHRTTNLQKYFGVKEIETINLISK